jgi:hypothetical protein
VLGHDSMVRGRHDAAHPEVDFSRGKWAALQARKVL